MTAYMANVSFPFSNLTIEEEFRVPVPLGKP